MWIIYDLEAFYCTELTSHNRLNLPVIIVIVYTGGGAAPEIQNIPNPCPSTGMTPDDYSQVSCSNFAISTTDVVVLTVLFTCTNAINLGISGN